MIKKWANSKSLEIKKQEACAVSIKEGTAASASSGFGDSFVIPLAEAIKSNALHIGLISAFSGLLSPISQYIGNKLMEKYSRKKIVRRFVFLQSLMWLLLVLVAYLYAANKITNYLPWLLILAYSLIAIFGGLAHPAWFSWMGDIVNEKERGKYFGKRSAITGLTGIIVALIGSIIMNKFKLLGIAFIGFGLMFSLAFIFRFISFSLFKKQYSPPFRLEKKYEFSLLDFIKRYDNFGKFAVYLAFFNFAIMIASPFFSFYLLRELGYSQNLILFMIISLSSSVFSLFFTPLAGRFSDKYGNLKLIYISSIFFILSPLVWLVSTNPIWLIIVPGIIAGIANSANSISITNFIYDSVSKEKRGTCIAYTNILVGIGVFLGALLGGFLLKYLRTNFTFNAFLILFAIGSTARLLVALFFLPKIKEVRKVKRLTLRSLEIYFSHPIKTIQSEISWLRHVFHQPFSQPKQL